MDDNMSYEERLKEKIAEMYETYLNEKLSLVFNGKIGELSHNVIRHKVLNDITKVDQEKLSYIFEKGTYTNITFNPSRFVEGYIILENWYDGRMDLIDMSGNFYFGMTYEMPSYILMPDVYGKLCKKNELHNVSEGWFLANLEADRYSNLDGYYYFSIQDKNLKIGPFTKAYDFTDGFAVVEKDGKWNVLNHDMRFVFPKSYDYITRVDFGRVKVRDGIRSKTIYLGMKDYEVKRSGFGYSCSNGKQQFKIKYQPVKMFDDKTVLCFHDNHYYLFDVNRNIYQKLDPLVVYWTYWKENVDTDVFYDDNFIYDKENKKVYFPYNGRLLDITEFYIAHLANIDKIKVKRDIGDIKTLDEFVSKNFDKVQEMMAEEREKNKAILERQQEEILQNEIKEKQKEEKEKLRKKEEDQKEGLIKLKEALELLRDDGINLGIKKIQYDISFIVVGDHLEIPKDFIQVLKYIDLSLFDFDNVKVSGIDFRGCNVEHINPQRVYNKDLSNCNFEGVYINPFISFDDVDIRGAKFGYDTNGIRIDMLNQSLERAIYDDTTTFNGIPLSLYLEKKQSAGK
jgi:hypothetical protein